MTQIEIQAKSCDDWREFQDWLESEIASAKAERQQPGVRDGKG